MRKWKYVSQRIDIYRYYYHWMSVSNFLTFLCKDYSLTLLSPNETICTLVSTNWYNNGELYNVAPLRDVEVLFIHSGTNSNQSRLLLFISKSFAIRLKMWCVVCNSEYFMRGANWLAENKVIKKPSKIIHDIFCTEINF